jgi:hypothetical protein
MAAVTNQSIAMFTFTVNPLNGAFSVRPVCKATDRLIIRELFCQEFYGDLPQPFFDDGLWEIYDSMKPTSSDVFGAYLVCYRERPLFLLEIHSPIQMDLTEAVLSQPGTIGIYCFYISLMGSLNLAALRTCIGSLLDQPGIDRILTTIAHPDPVKDARTTLLERAGFQPLPESPGRVEVYICTMESFTLRRGQNKVHKPRWTTGPSAEGPSSTVFHGRATFMQKP